jgi:hypothetical protein
MKRRSGDLNKKRTEENWKSMHENRSVHIGGARSSGTAGTRV